MKARGMVVLVAFLLASTATAAVFMYVKGVKEEARTGGDMVEVIVAKRDVPAGSDMDALISSGAFTSRSILKDTLVRGAVTSLSQLEGRRSTVPILAGEQISTARMQGSTELPGGALGIPEGFMAIAVQLEMPRVAGGAVAQGDHVAVYASFQDVDALSSIGQDGSAKTGEFLGSVDITTTLVPDVQVLRVGRPAVDRTGDKLVVTLALLPDDAQRFVYAQENGTVWLGLLPPDEEGVAQSPISIGQVIK